MINVEHPGAVPDSVVASTGIERSLLDNTIEVRVEGNVSGQMAVGDHNLIVKADHGAIVNILKDAPTIRRRVGPAVPKLRQTGPLIGREREVADAWSVLQAAQPFEFFAQPGSGKTAVLKYIACMPGGKAVDGATWNDREEESTADLLQLIFDAFYDSSVPMKPTPGQLREYLQTIRALVVLDDMNVPRERLDALMDAAPQCTFLFASEERNLWSAGRAEALQGLSFSAAMDLVERALERSLKADEQQVIERLWRAVRGGPLSLIQSAVRVRDGESLRTVVEEMERMDADQAIAGRIHALSDSERRVLAVAIALEGAPLNLEHVAALCGTDAAGAVQLLVRKGLLDSTRRDIRFPLAITPLLREAAGSEAWGAPIRTYFGQWSQKQSKGPAVLLRSWPALRVVVRLAVKAGESVVVFALAKAIEQALALSGLWDAWESMLQNALHAARELRDRKGEAWALHQLGTRLICLGQVAAGTALLNEALKLRTSIGDNRGAKATRHNLGAVSRTKVLAGLVQSIGLKGLLLIAPIVLLIGAGSWVAVHAFAAGIASLQPAQLDFQRVAVGSTAIRSASLTNTGEGQLHVASIKATGDFRQTNDCPPSLKPHQACQVQVLFQPTKAGLREGSLTIGESAASSHVIGLKGTGVVGQVGFQPPQLDFGQLSPKSSSTVREVAVNNAGTFDLVVSRVTTTGDFSVVSSFLHSPATLRPGQSGIVRIQFSPSAAGTRTGILSITAAGVEASMTLMGTGGRGMQPASLDFGKQSLKLPSDTKTLIFPNDGTLPLTIDTVTATGDFTVLGPCMERQAVVPPSGSCDLSVTFIPSDGGLRSGTLTLTDTAGGRYESALSGFALVPMPVVPSVLDWGFVMPPAPILQRLLIQNNGDGVLSISSVRLDPASDPGFSVVTDGCSRIQMTPGRAPCVVAVGFTPERTRSPGNAQGTLVIADNALTSPQIVALKATAAFAHLTVSPLSLDFGSLPVNSSSSIKDLHILNDGNRPLSVTVVSTGDARIVEGYVCPPPLAPGATCTVSVYLHATAVGPRSGSFVITSSPDSGQQTVQVQGVGIGAVAKLSSVSLSFKAGSPPQSVTLTNTGNGPMTIRIAGPFTKAFLETDDCPAILAPGKQCTITVQYTPYASGPFMDSLEIYTNAVNGPNFKISLYGG